jgi:hypothetical protein
VADPPKNRTKGQVQQELDRTKQEIEDLTRKKEGSRLLGRNIFGQGASDAVLATRVSRGKFNSSEQVKLDEANRKLDELNDEMKRFTALDDQEKALKEESAELMATATRRALTTEEVKKLNQLGTQTLAIEHSRQDFARATAQRQAYRGLQIAKAKQTRRTSDGGTPQRVNANRDIMRQAVGLAPLENAGILQPIYKKGAGVSLTDANGNLITDGEGNEIDSKGNKILIGYANAPEYNAPLGSLQNGGQRSGSTLTPRTINMTNGMSPREIGLFYTSLNETELRQFQNILMEAGYYGESGKPTLGTRDGATSDALNLWIQDWMQNPDMSVVDLLNTKKAETNALLQQKIADMSGVGTASDFVTKNIQITNPETIGAIIDQVAETMYGTTRVSPEIRQQIIAMVQAQDRQYGTTAAKAAYESERQARMVESGSGNATEFEAFVEALIGQESGGEVNAQNERTGAMGLGQILPTNWAPWATEAGQNPADFSEANQRRVIKYKLAKYYQMYGNWRDVASVWYSGSPTTVYTPGELTRGQGPSGNEPSINRYADELTGRMQAILQTKMANGGGGLTINELTEAPNQHATIKNQLMQLDPARFAGSEFERQATNFFTLIKGYGDQGAR